MALKKVGVSLEADQAQKFYSTLAKADKSVQDFGEDAGKASKGVDKLGDSADKSGSKVGGFFKTAFAMATGGLILKAVDGITSSLGGLVKGMIGGNAEFENYNTRFAVMLGSADAAKQRMKELADFGAKTPFELPGVVEADTVLQGFGLHSEEAAKKFGFSGSQILTIAGDVASGTGSDFKEMALLIGKFSSGATGEAISRMQELGITNRDELTKMGLEFSKSGQLLSPLPEAMQVVLGLMQTKYGGLMDAQSATFSGMMSNLQDWVGGTLRTLGAPLFDVVKQQLSGLLAFLNDPGTMAALNGFAQGLAGGIQRFMSWLQGSAIPWITGTGLPALQTAFTTVWPIISNAVGTVYSYFSGTIWPWFQNTAFPWLSDTAIPTMRDAFTEAWPRIQGAVETVYTFLHDTVWAWLKADAFPWLVNTGLPGIAQAFADSWPKNKKTVEDFYTFMHDTFFPFLKTEFGNLKNNELPEQSAAWTTSMDTAYAATMKHADYLHDKWGPTVAETLGKVKANLQDFETYWDPTWEDLDHVVTVASANLQHNWNEAINGVIRDWNQLKSDIYNAWQDINTTLVNAVNDVETWAGNVVAEVKALPGKITDALGAMGKLLYQAGIDVIAGFISGIQSKIPSMTSILSGITSLIPKFKGPPEKDKKLLFPSGQWIMQGLLDGFNSMVPTIRLTLTGIGGGIADALTGGFVERTPMLQTTLADGIHQAMAAMVDRITVDGAAVVSAMEQMVADYNAAVGKIQQPAFDISGGYADRGPNWDPNDPGTQRYTNFKPQYGSLPMSRNNTGYTAKTISPPASSSQLMQRSMVNNTSIANNYHYAPSYAAAPNNPSQDFHLMQVFAR
jgi:hypothetical protein